MILFLNYISPVPFFEAQSRHSTFGLSSRAKVDLSAVFQVAEGLFPGTWMAGSWVCLVLGESVDEVCSRHVVGMVVLGGSVACVLCGCSCGVVAVVCDAVQVVAVVSGPCVVVVAV